MQFKTARAAFDWLIQHKNGQDDRNCWHAVLAYQQQRKWAESGWPAARRIATSALVFVADYGFKDDDIRHFTDGNGSQLIDAVNTFVAKLVKTGGIVT